MTDLIYVPEIKGNFLSIRALTRMGYTVQFYDEFGDISINGKVIIRAKIKMNYSNTVKICATSKKSKIKLNAYTIFIVVLVTVILSQSNE